MSEYIEREAALAVFGDIHPLDYNAQAYASQIRGLPAVDVRPVVKATWKRIDYKPCGHDYECSSCGWKNDMETHFCPNCGAEMEGTV